jgi:hypothetical protein
LVLGLRLGFFTNNVVGNHLMLAIRTAGIGGFRAYLTRYRKRTAHRWSER